MAAETKKLPTIALLGATGNCGREALRILLTKGGYEELRLYVRSAKKLNELFPGIEATPKVRLFIGPVSDQDNMERCLDGASIILLTLGTNNLFASSVHCEAANTIIPALKCLQQRTLDWQRPRMIMLSSASWNKRFSAARPWVVDLLVKSAFQAGYTDLQAADKMYSRETSLLSLLSVQPGMLVNEKGTGYGISTESVSLAVAYPDLGAGFVELALERQYDSLSQVGVSSAGGDRFLHYMPDIISRLICGISAQYIPGAYRINRFVTSLWT